MKSLTPAQSLALLLLVGLSAAGWFYGVHWKRVASGDLFTADEKHIIRLQEQIDSLTKENESLHLRLRELEGGETSATGPAPVPSSPSPAPATDAPVVLPTSGTGPNLPPPPQKIETH